MASGGQRTSLSGGLTGKKDPSTKVLAKAEELLRHWLMFGVLVYGITCFTQAFRHTPNSFLWYLFTHLATGFWGGAAGFWVFGDEIYGGVVSGVSLPIVYFLQLVIRVQPFTFSCLLVAMGVHVGGSFLGGMWQAYVLSRQ